MTKFKYIPKTDEGIKFVLQVLNKTKEHNRAFYSNTFRYFIKEHKPFANSLILYHPEDNFFRFISRSKLIGIPIKSWQTYQTGELCLIKLLNFAIYSQSPFFIIVSNAEFLLEDVNIDKTSLYFHKYMSDNCEKEISSWKLLLNIHTKIENKL